MAQGDLAAQVSTARNVLGSADEAPILKSAFCLLVVRMPSGVGHTQFIQAPVLGSGRQPLFRQFKPEKLAQTGLHGSNRHPVRLHIRVGAP